MRNRAYTACIMITILGSQSCILHQSKIILGMPCYTYSMPQTAPQTKIDIEARRNAVRYQMLCGERHAASIARRLKAKHDMVISADTVQNDMDAINEQHHIWKDALASGHASLRIQQIDEYLLEDIEMMQKGIRELFDKGFAQSAHKISWIMPQMIQTMQYFLTLQEKHAMYESTKELHTRLKEKERQLLEESPQVN